MAKRIPCQRRVKGEDCPDKATLYVRAFGGKAWDGYFCDTHGPRIIRLRMRLIKKYKQNVVLRPITAYDRKQRKERMKQR